MTRTTATRICRRITHQETALPGVHSARVVSVASTEQAPVCGVLLCGRTGQPLALVTEVEHYQALAQGQHRWAPMLALMGGAIQFPLINRSRNDDHAAREKPR